MKDPLKEDMRFFDGGLMGGFLVRFLTDWLPPAYEAVVRMTLLLLWLSYARD
jgi:hypothetical protein